MINTVYDFPVLTVLFEISVIRLADISQRRLRNCAHVRRGVKPSFHPPHPMHYFLIVLHLVATDYARLSIITPVNVAG